MSATPTATECRSYWRNAFKAAREDHKLPPFIRGPSAAVIATLFKWYSGSGFQKAKDLFALAGYVVLAYLVLLLLEFLWRAFVLTPPKLHNEFKKALQQAQTESEALGKEKQEKDVLELALEHDEAIVIFKNTLADCRVEVKNTSKWKTVEEVRLSLVSITYPTGENKMTRYGFGATGRDVGVYNPIGAFSHHRPTFAVALHPEDFGTFDVIKYVKVGITNHFTIQARHLGSGSDPIVNLTADETQKLGWRLMFKAVGRDVVPKQRVFTLESDGPGPPRFYAV
jgi:hypothetical protein